MTGFGGGAPIVTGFGGGAPIVTGLAPEGPGGRVGFCEGEARGKGAGEFSHSSETLGIDSVSALIHVQPARNLDLDGMHTLRRLPVVSRREAAAVRIVVPDRETKGFSVGVDPVDDGAGRAGPAPAPGNQVRSKGGGWGWLARSGGRTQEGPGLAGHRVGAEQHHVAEAGDLALEERLEGAVVGPVDAVEAALELAAGQRRGQDGVAVGGEVPHQAARGGGAAAALHGGAVEVALPPVEIDDEAADAGDEQGGALDRRVAAELVHVEVGVPGDAAGRGAREGERLRIDPQPGVGDLDHHGGLPGPGLDDLERLHAAPITQSAAGCEGFATGRGPHPLKLPRGRPAA